MVHKLTAAQAAADYQNGTLPAHAVVDDTAANIVEFLDTLQQIALAGKLRAIEISGNALLNLDVAQVENDALALSKIKASYQLAIQDSAANVLAGLSSLEHLALHHHLQSIVLTGSGHPTIQVTAAQVRQDMAVLLKISGSSNVIVADGHAAIAANLDNLQKLAAAGELSSIHVTDNLALNVSAAQLRQDAKALAAISGSYQLVVKDSSANVATYISYLESAAQAGHLQKIVLTDSGALSLTSKQFFSDTDAIAKISGAYSLSVTGVSAANATTVAANAHVTGLFISDTAAHIQQYLSQLENLTGGGAHAERGVHPASNVLDGITLTDGGTPTLSLSESTLSGAEGVLDLITSPFLLDVTGVLASDALSLSGNALVDLISVSDSAASVAANLGALETVNGLGKIGTVTVTDGPLATTDVSNAAFALYEHFTGSNGVTLTLSYTDPRGTGVFGEFLANGGASLGITVPIGLVVPGGSDFERTFLFQIQHAADSGYLASLTMSNHIEVEDMSSSDLLLLNNTTIINAVFGTGFLVDYTAAAFTAAQAAQYFASAVSLAVENSTTSILYNGGYQITVSDAAVISGIVDSAADIQANLDAFTAALDGRPLTLPIQLTDTLPPTISVTATQAIQDAAILNAITSSYLLSINGSASALNSIDLSVLGNEKIELSFTNLNHDVTVEGGNIFDINLAHLLVANDIISVEAYSSGGQTGTEIDLTGTDGLAHKIILLGVDPSTLIVYTPFDTGTALGGHGTQVTGGVSVAAALGSSGFVAITDTAANVQVNLDALEAIHNRITGIGFSDSGTPTLSLSEAQLTTDSDVLALFSGTYHIALTGVFALDAANLAGRTDVSSIAVSDSTADVVAHLDDLEHIAKAGKLAGITLTDGGTPGITLSEAQLFADQDALSAISSNFSLDVTGVLASDALSLSGNALVDLISVSDSAASVAANLGALETVNGLGKIGTVTVTDGPLATTDVSNAAFALYEHFTGSNGVTLTLSYTDPRGTGVFGEFLANGGASLGITVPIGLVVPGGSDFERTFLFQIQHAADSGYLASLTMSNHIEVEDMSSSDLLLLNNTTIINAVFGTGFLVDYTAAAFTAAQAAQYFASAVSLAVENSTTSILYNGGYQITVSDAAVISGIVDSAADIQANLDAFTAALDGRPLTLPIQLTDTLPPTISVTATQAIQDAAILNAITSSYLLSINGSASALNSIDLSVLGNEKIELSFTNLNHDVTVEGGNIFDINLAHLLVANDIISVEAYSSGGQTGTEIDLTGTDGLAHKIILLGVDPSTLIVYTPFDTGTALGGHGTQVTGGVSVAAALGSSGFVAITDTAANVQVNLDALEAIHNRITGIGFSNSGTPTLSLSEAQLTTDSDVLALFSGTYHIALTGVFALDAANLAGRTDVSSIAVSDSTADVVAHLDDLEHIAKAGKLAGITLTDGGTPGITLSEAQLFADQDALSAISSNFSLDVTGVLASDALSLSGNALVDLISVSDSAASVAANLGALETVNGLGKIGTVTVTDGPLATTDVSNAAFALYEHFTGSNGVTLTLSYTDPRGTGVFGEFLANGGASLGITVPIGLVVPGGSDFERTFLFQIQHAADSGYLASLTMSNHIEVEDMSSSDLLLLNNTTIINAVFGTGFLVDYTAAAFTAAQAAQYFASAVSLAVENSTTSILYNGGYQITVSDAAVISGIVDSAADIQANLDAFTAALDGRPLTLPIQLTDTLPPTISVTATQAIQDAAVLNQISSTFLLSVGGTAEDLNGLTFSPTSSEKVELALTSLDHDITITGNIFDVDLAKLAVANDTVTVSAYSSGGQTGTEIDLTGTDGLAHKIIILGENPDSFEVYTPVDSGVAAGSHGAQVTGGVTVAQALVNSGPEAISDTASNVAANLDALESIVAQITGIGFTDAGTPTVSVTEAQFSADHDVLALLSGSYNLDVTGVAATDALGLAAYTDVSGVSVSDTGTNLAAELDQLEHVYKLGKLEGVTITSGDLGTLTETQLLADADVLKMIGSSGDFWVT